MTLLLEVPTEKLRRGVRAYLLAPHTTPTKPSALAGLADPSLEPPLGSDLKDSVRHDVEQELLRRRHGFVVPSRNTPRLVCGGGTRGARQRGTLPAWTRSAEADATSAESRSRTLRRYPNQRPSCFGAISRGCIRASCNARQCVIPADRAQRAPCRISPIQQALLSACDSSVPGPLARETSPPRSKSGFPRQSHGSPAAL